MTLSDDRLRLLDRDLYSTRVPGRPQVEPLSLANLPRMLHEAQAMADVDHLDAAYAQCGAVADAAERWQATPILAAALSLRSAILRRRGDLPASAQDAERAAEALAGSDADRRSDPALQVLARRITTQVDLGHHERAGELLDGTGPDLPDTRDGVRLRFARGRSHLGAGRPDAALPDLFHCGERLAAQRADRPAVLAWRSAAATALWRGGAHESAARLAHAEADLARRGGTAAALGRALRVSGVVQGGAAGLAELEESARVLEASPRRFELALTLVELGTRLNELKRRPPARRVLRAGMELAERCGSPALVDRARAQYTIAGGRLRPVLPTGVSGLTASERRAVSLAASGRTNRQIAEGLFLSIRTVEIHLTNAYRKLGIARRSELAAALAAVDDVA
jgi:DNA-binding CsgD family transcriptional regulator